MRRFLTLVVFACALLFAPRATAQLRWDASAGAGVMHRWFNEKPLGGHEPGFGPSGEVAVHIALLPLIRVGAYFGADISPWDPTSPTVPRVDRDATRTAASGGVQAVVYIPVFPRAMRGWVSLGFGLGSEYWRSVHVLGDPRHLLGSERDGFGEVPVGLGASYTFWKPWSVYAELAGRALFWNSQSDSVSDSWAVGLSAGIMVEL